MKEIQLTQDQITRVDDKDFDRLSQYRYHARWNPDTESFYAQRNVRQPDGSFRLVQMHREIMGLDPGDPRDVHHRDGDTLNNTRKNLRVVTRLEHNHLHRNDPRKDVSPYGIGVRRRSSGRFEAHARIDGKQHYLGMHATAQEARDARETFLEEAVA